MLDKSKTYALALSGGGLKGAYQAGAIYALYNENIKINAAVGTSVGSLNAAMIASSTPEKLKELWYSFTLSNIFIAENDTIEKILNLDLKDLPLKDVKESVARVLRQGGLDISPLKEFILENVSEEKLRKSDIDFGLVTLSLTDKRGISLMKDQIPQGQLRNFLLASCYLPIFKSEKLNGKTYVDGGIYNNVPSSLLVENGYMDIIEIKLNKFDIIKKVEVKANISTIETKEDLGRFMSYDKKKTDYIFNLGYYDAQRLIYSLAGDKFYISEPEDEIYYLTSLLKIDENLVLRILDSNIIERLKVDISNLPKERLIIENFLPYLAKELELEKNYSFKGLYIKLLEKAMEKLEYPRFEIYHLHALEADILRKLPSYSKSLTTSIIELFWS